MIPGRLVFVDVETTGADPREDRITEVAAVLVDDGELTEEWSTLVNPGRHIPHGIETLTGITNAMVEAAPPFEAIALDLAARLDGRILVAHNARFDSAFLRNEFRRAGLAFRVDVLCSVRLSRRLFPQFPRHNLDALIERHALPSDGRHRALPDARLVHRFFHALGREVAAERLQDAAAAVLNAGSLPPGLDVARFDDLPDLPGVYVLHDPAGEPLFAGKAANLRSQVLAHFASARNAAAREQHAALQAGGLEWTVTAGELGAALRHLRLLETLAPRHNRRPRRNREAWALRWQPDGAHQLVAAIDLDTADVLELGTLYGPFRSRVDAYAALRGIAREHRLCRSLVGLDPPGLPCPPDHPCNGACRGREPRPAHMLRLIEALVRMRLAAWPFPGAAVIVEQDPARTRTELHLIRAWRYLGSGRTLDELAGHPGLRGDLPPFDVDLYRVLQRALEDRRRFSVLNLSDAVTAEALGSVT